MVVELKMLGQIGNWYLGHIRPMPRQHTFARLASNTTWWNWYTKWMAYEHVQCGDTVNTLYVSARLHVFQLTNLGITDRLVAKFQERA